MLLAENLLLLVTDEASGRLRVPGDQLDPALAGANLVELTMMGRVDLSGEGSAGKPGRLIVPDSSQDGAAPGSGLGTRVHAAPFQCSIRALLNMPAPTAQASSAETAATSLR
jgi:hypothetical protein